jgi:hypothetical protein
LKEWIQGEAVIKQAIAGTIPDSLFMMVRREEMGKKMWDSVIEEFEKRSQMVMVDLCRKLQEEGCSEKGDVQAHHRVFGADLVCLVVDDLQ